jgi:glycosyltransferase involved in cell wall biosynthesis
MGRNIGYRGKTILFVSDGDHRASGDTQVMPVPQDMGGISNDDLIQHYCIWRGHIIRNDSPKNPADIRVAFISNYDAPCGIATYSKWLYDAIGPLVKDYRIFAEHNQSKTEDDPRVIRCWKRNEKTTELVAKIGEWDPDVILIQHEYGLWPDARIWLSLLTQLGKYRVIVTLHSVYKNHYDKMLCELAIPEIIVHTEAARDIIVGRRIPGNVYVIPHGSPELAPEPRPWNMYRSDHTIIQYGFGFRHKGWETAISLVAKLREKYADVFLTGLFSESPFSKRLHDEYYAELDGLIKKLGVQDNVGMIRGFTPEPLLLHALRMNRLGIFPYVEDNGEHTVYGCSGAARVAMKCCIPIIASKAPLFDDLEGVVPRIRNLDELHAEACIVFDNPTTARNQVEKQKAFLSKTSWANVGRAYARLFSAKGQPPV